VHETGSAEADLRVHRRGPDGLHAAVDGAPADDAQQRTDLRIRVPRRELRARGYSAWSAIPGTLEVGARKRQPIGFNTRNPSLARNNVSCVAPCATSNRYGASKTWSYTISRVGDSSAMRQRCRSRGALPATASSDGRPAPPRTGSTSITEKSPNGI